MWLEYGTGSTITRTPSYSVISGMVSSRYGAGIIALEVTIVTSWPAATQRRASS